ncbi:MAG: Zn-dependent hydrolase [Chloroflexi bacterium]|nr:Zn-dependent hydrolase [Chloroflexota bacterium]
MLQPRTARLAADFERLGEVGGEANNGVSRLPFSREERLAHRLVGEWMKEAGLEVLIDSFGNSVGLRRGRRSDLPAIALGSHLDTVPHGGRFDGAVGVLGGLEAVRVLDEAAITTEHPLWLVAFASEEGARFGEPCLGSKAVSGVLEPGDLDRLRDAAGCTLTEAMRQLGMDPSALPSTRWRRDQVAAFLEMHIEQSRVLEVEQKRIGLVDAVAGNTRVRLRMKGRADHSGGTPMHYRKDALAAAAEVVLAAEAIANEPRRRATVATVGRLEVSPNSITTIPGQVVCYLDVRDLDSDRQRATAQDIVTMAQQVAVRRGVELEYDVISDTSPTVLPMWLRDLTTEVCRRLELPYRVMSSGAGHDAAILSRFLPAAMVFVPSHEGLSHCPEEWTSIEDIALGVRVLVESVLTVDRFLTEQVAP